jgi:hypothetical protein
LDERYVQIRTETELARRDLRNKGWARLSKALGDLVRLSPDFTMDAACRTILSKSSQEVFRVLDAWSTTEWLAEVGFDEKILRGPKEPLEWKFNSAPPNAFAIAFR